MPTTGALSPKTAGAKRWLREPACALAFALLLAGCWLAEPKIEALPERGFAERAMSDARSLGGVTVGVEILTPAEVAREFDLPLLGHDIWPVWLTVENTTKERLLFSPVAFDPEHFSPVSRPQ